MSIGISPPSCAVAIFFLSFLSIQLQRFIVVAFTSFLICKIIYSVIVEPFPMMSSLLSEDVTVEKGLTINDSILFASNSSLSTTYDNCTLTRRRNAFISLLVSV